MGSTLTRDAGRCCRQPSRGRSPAARRKGHLSIWQRHGNLRVPNHLAVHVYTGTSPRRPRAPSLHHSSGPLSGGGEWSRGAGVVGTGAATSPELKLKPTIFGSSTRGMPAAGDPKGHGESGTSLRLGERGAH